MSRYTEPCPNCCEDIKFSSKDIVIVSTMTHETLMRCPHCKKIVKIPVPEKEIRI